MDTDRLKEEKERGISIELGFAPLKLPSGEVLGLVDVPGHERFVRQMLAGVAGIDLVLLVVAADEGVMPQTQEHLEIIDLLRVKEGIIVLTKADLADAELLALVKEEVAQLVKGTVLEKAPVVTVSAVTGEGIPELVCLLEEVAARTPPKASSGAARLPIDRAFLVTGFGTVVTGTLWSGKISLGENLEILPQGLSVRVRGLQVHGQPVRAAFAGQRVAVNLAGVDGGQVFRGNVLVSPRRFYPSSRLDLELKLLPSAPRELPHGVRLRFHLGTSETLGKLVLLDREKLAPGETAFVQFLPEKPLVAARYDRFIIRSLSPVRTVGGGVVVEPQAPRRKRFRQEVLTQLEATLYGSPQEQLKQLLTAEKKLWSPGEIKLKLGWEEEKLAKVLAELEKEGGVLKITEGGESSFLSRPQAETWEKRLEDALAAYHQKYPLREGFPQEELRSRFFSFLTPKAFVAFLNFEVQRGKIKFAEGTVVQAGFTAAPVASQEEKMVALENVYRMAHFQPPPWESVIQSLGLKESEAEEFLAYLFRKGVLVKVSPEIYFHTEAVAEAKRVIDAYLAAHGEITLAEARDLCQSSRRSMLPLLEYFDQVKFTKRVGDRRVAFKTTETGVKA